MGAGELDGAESESSMQLFKLSGDSSPSSSSSAESSFRELDHVFLQTQTRIWLGEVLQTRLDEQMNISDLLADGELLFQASRVVWKMLLKKRMELKYTKVYKYEPFASRKSSGKYTPYSNVDSFLKICKILGLAGIDLFTPSDVVEKRDTRKVCMCIRSLSKKARSKHLSVPDFDIVTYTVAMPTDMVGWIRRSLELSQCDSLSSPSYYSQKHLRAKCMQNNLVSASARSYHSYSEECDEIESNHMVFQSDGSSGNCSHDAACQMNSHLEYSPGVSSATKDYTLTHSLELGIQKKEKVENTQCQSESLCESVGSICSEHDYQLNGMSSPSCIDSNVYSSGRAYTESGVRQSHENDAMDLIHVDLDQGNDASALGDSTDTKTPMNFITHKLPISNTCSHGIYCSDSILFGAEDSNAYTTNSSHDSNSTHRNFRNGFRRLSDDEMEVSSTANMCSLSVAMLNLDFDDQLDAEDDYGTVCSSNLQNHETDLFSAETMGVDTSQDIVKYETFVQNIASDTDKPSFDMEVVDHGPSTNFFIPCSDLKPHTNGFTDNVFHNESKLPQVDSNKDLDFEMCGWSPIGQYTSQPDLDKWDLEDKYTVAMESNGDDLGSPLSSASREGLHEEKSCHSLTKDANSAIEIMDVKSIVSDNDKDVFSAVMTEAVANINKRIDNHIQAVDFDNIDTTYEDSNASPKKLAVEGSEKGLNLSSTDDGGGFECHDTTTQGIIVDKMVVNSHFVHNDFVLPADTSGPIPDKHFSATIEGSANEGENGYQVCGDHIDLFCCSENMDKVHDQDERKHGKVGTMAVENADANGEEDVNVGTQNRKPQRRPLLKSVVKGTALVTVLFIVFHLRRSGRENTGESTKESSQIRKTNSVKLSSRKGQKGGRAGGIYPAENLNFWN